MKIKHKKYSAVRRRIELFADKLISFFYPDICVMCGDVCEGAFCERCRPHYTEALNCVCDVCGNVHSKCCCGDNVGRKTKLIHMGVYHPKARDTAIGSLLLEIKHGTRNAVSEAANSMAKRLTEIPNIEKYTVTWVPRRKGGILKEGCDQAQRLAYEIASLLMLDARELIRREGGDEQKYLSRTQRALNVKKSFAAIDISPDFVILVDDVTTTAATLRHCATLLKRNGAKFVTCITLARTELGTATFYDKIIDDI